MAAANRDLYQNLWMYNSYMVEQQDFDTVFELASAATRRDYLAWKAADGKKHQQTESKMITDKEVRDQGSLIKLVAPADGDGKYLFEIHESGGSQAYYSPPTDGRDDLGALFFAELTDRQELVDVKEGWFDTRV
jgi:hypothetical protein